MISCPTCGHENPSDNKFCGACGAILAAPELPTAEERKVVTVLFCDLVGFTAASEQADPEDVRQMLSGYFAMARRHIEGYGGTVEKFIGDAIVGVFGAPITHEDDPERAIHAALRIVEDAEQMQFINDAPLQLRIGINTGEVLVRLSAGPLTAEGAVTGDAINTASRLQAIAPPMGVAVGLLTYESTSLTFNFTEREPALLKGKSSPVRVFVATSPRARLGDDARRRYDTPFVGRQVDLALLKGFYAKGVDEESVQVVTVVGEPGLGKSRIVSELARHLDDQPDLINWRQGRCVPYGEGVTFWALSEIVKSHAGILDSDPHDLASSKLERVLPEGPERQWFHQRLLPLLGIEASSGATRSELFTAWRRFIESIAEADPTVVVFEDLHFADQAMLDFVEHLIEHAGGVPLLVVATTRPELFEEHPEFAPALRKNATINLSPLSEPETGRLVAALLGASAELPSELEQTVIERAGGNPLYAEEFVRLLKDRDLLIEDGSVWHLVEGADLPISESVHAIISARLDGLGVEAKGVLTDAAVIGMAFWADAVAAMGERGVPSTIETLHELSRRELVRAVRHPSIDGEVEYAFTHLLVREVAYSQLPRAARATRHVAAAHWIESKAAHRLEDVADVLAHHYSTALNLATASGDLEFAKDLQAPTLRFLTLSGDRALGLDTSTALMAFERALALTPPGHPDRPSVLYRYAVALANIGRYAESVAPLEEAIEANKQASNIPAAANAMTQLSIAMSRLGDPRWATLTAEGVEILTPLPPGPQLVDSLANLALDQALQGKPAEGVEHAEQALALAEELGLPQPLRALGYRGVARSLLGDVGGTDDLREAIDLAAAAGSGEEVARLQNNLGMALWTLEGPELALEVLRQGIDLARPRGLTGWVVTMSASTLDLLVDLGRLDEAAALAADMLENLKDSGDVFDLVGVRTALVRIMAFRGDAERVASQLEWLESTARGQGSAEDIVMGLGSAALARQALNQTDATIQLLSDIEASPGVRGSQYYPPLLPSFVRAAVTLGRLDLGQRLASGVDPRYTYTQHALAAADATLTEARGEWAAAVQSHDAAAKRWETFGVVPEHAFSLLGEGRSLHLSGNAAEAQRVLTQSRSIFEGLGATPALAIIDDLLATH